jgi:hypothetical protein
MFEKTSQKVNTVDIVKMYKCQEQISVAEARQAISNVNKKYFENFQKSVFAYIIEVEDKIIYYAR